MTKEVGYIYLNGLGDGTTKWHERLAMRMWNRHGIPLEHYPVDWYADKGLDQLVGEVSGHVREMLENMGRVAIIGSSAGGSLAVNVLHANPGLDIRAVSSRGRLAVGDYPASHHMSLENQAKSSRLFVASVKGAQAAISELSDDEKQRIMVLRTRPGTDRAVPTETMLVPGAETHDSIVPGHTGAWAAHMLAGRNRSRIVRFATHDLESESS